MEKFTEQLKKLAANIKESGPVDGNSESPAIKMLFDFAEKGIDTLRSEGISSIQLHVLSSELVPLFFHFESRGSGFVISTDKKYTFFMQSRDGKIFIYGKNRRYGQKNSVNEKMQQLFNIDFTEENEKVSFFDSTKKEIVADEIVLLALRWSLN